MARTNLNKKRPTAKRPAEDEADENGRTAKKVRVAGKGTRAQAAAAVIKAANGINPRRSKRIAERAESAAPAVATVPSPIASDISAVSEEVDVVMSNRVVMARDENPQADPSVEALESNVRALVESSEIIASEEAVEEEDQCIPSSETPDNFVGAVKRKRPADDHASDERPTKTARTGGSSLASVSESTVLITLQQRFFNSQDMTDLVAKAISNEYIPLATEPIRLRFPQYLQDAYDAAELAQNNLLDLQKINSSFYASASREYARCLKLDMVGNDEGDLISEIKRWERSSVQHPGVVRTLAILEDWSMNELGRLVAAALDVTDPIKRKVVTLPPNTVSRHYARLGRDWLERMMMRCHQLNTLVVRSSPEMTAQVLKAFTASCRQVKTLEFGDCIAGSGPGLFLDFVNNEELLGYAGVFASVRILRLDLSQYRGGPDAPDRLQKLLALLPNLTELVVKNTSEAQALIASLFLSQGEVPNVTLRNVTINGEHLRQFLNRRVDTLEGFRLENVDLSLRDDKLWQEIFEAIKSLLGGLKSLTLHRLGYNLPSMSINRRNWSIPFSREEWGDFEFQHKEMTKGKDARRPGDDWYDSCGPLRSLSRQDRATWFSLLAAIQDRGDALKTDIEKSKARCRKGRARCVENMKEGRGKGKNIEYRCRSTRKLAQGEMMGQDVWVCNFHKHAEYRYEVWPQLPAHIPIPWR